MGATACIMIFILGAAMYRLQDSLSFPTITVLPACGAKGSLGWRVSGVGKESRRLTAHAPG